MSKFGLGRGLGNLMKGDKIAGQAPIQSPTENGEPEASPGVGSLLRGKKNVFAEPQVDAAATATPTPTPVKKELIPLWYFFAADVLLMGFAALILWRTPVVTWKEVLFAIVAVGLGAALSVIAVLKRRPEAEE